MGIPTRNRTSAPLANTIVSPTDEAYDRLGIVLCPCVTKLANTSASGSELATHEIRNPEAGTQVDLQRSPTRLFLQRMKLTTVWGSSNTSVSKTRAGSELATHETRNPEAGTQVDIQRLPAQLYPQRMKLTAVWGSCSAHVLLSLPTQVYPKRLQDQN